jgi:hypothetical protein
MAGNAANSIRKAGRCHSSVIFIATCYETSNEPESPDLPFLTSLRDSLSPPRRAAGLFLCHAPCGQVMAHFERLRHESRDLVDWTLVPDEGHFNDPRGDETYPHQSLSMPRRFAQARALGRLTDGAGLMDIAIMPRVLAAPHEFVWALEYDVDYSGHWSKLFKRFARNRADILTTTLLPRPRNADWALWATARRNLPGFAALTPCCACRAALPPPISRQPIQATGMAIMNSSSRPWAAIWAFGSRIWPPQACHPGAGRFITTPRQTPL